MTHSTNLSTITNTFPLIYVYISPAGKTVNIAIMALTTADTNNTQANPNIITSSGPSNVIKVCFIVFVFYISTYDFVDLWFI